MWWYVSWILGVEAAGIYESWLQHTAATVHKATVGFDLGTQSWEKEYFGLPELRLLFATVTDMVAKVDWYKQHYVAWAMSFICGMRPGLLAVSTGYPKEQCLRWKDITIYRNLQGKGLFLLIHCRWMKGSRDPYRRGINCKDGKFLIMSVKSAVNLVADLTWLVPCLALERGFSPGKTLADLEASTEAILTQNPAVTELPVFTALSGPNNSTLAIDKPIYTESFGEPLRRVAHKAGLAVRVTMYVWRREVIAAISREAGVDQAKELAGHKIDGNDTYDHYDYGTGDLELVQMRLGEGSDANVAAKLRNHIRRLTSAQALTPISMKLLKISMRSCKALQILSKSSSTTIL